MKTNILKFTAFLLILAGFFSACENEPESKISGLTFTPCKQTQQTKAKSNAPADRVNVEFTTQGVHITYNHFEVTCDFSTVDVTYTFVNGFLNITQQGLPNRADCVCYSDVSYTINGISQNEVNVIFINGEQVYCYENNNENHCSTWEWLKNYIYLPPPPGQEVDITLTFDSLQSMVYVSTNPSLCNERIGAYHYLFCDGEQYVFSMDTLYFFPPIAPNNNCAFAISNTRYVCDTIDLEYLLGVPLIPGYITNYTFRKTH